MCILCPVLLVETNPFPNLSLFYRTMLFEYPSVLSLFCLNTSHYICGIYTIADLYIPCHILVMAGVLWIRVVNISHDTVSTCPLHLSLSLSLAPLTPFNHSWCSWTYWVVLPYSRVVLLPFGIVQWCIWHLHPLCPYCTTTPAQLIGTCLVVLLQLYPFDGQALLEPDVHSVKNRI